MSDKLFSSIIITVSILILFLLILPSYDRTRVLLSSIQERKNLLKEQEEIVSQIADQAGLIDQRSYDINRLDNFLPREKDIPELLVNIETIAANAGLNLRELNFSEVPSRGEIQKLNGTIQLTGSFSSFLAFLDLLEDNLRLIEVVGIDIAPQLLEGTRIINYNLRIETNYLGKVE